MLLPFELADALEEMDIDDVASLLAELEEEKPEAYEALCEKIEDL